jgi:hypothetical protein
MTWIKRLILKILGIIILESVTNFTLEDIIRHKLEESIAPLYKGNDYQYLSVLTNTINAVFPNIKVGYLELSKLFRVNPAPHSLIKKEEVDYDKLANTIKLKMMENV